MHVFQPEGFAKRKPNAKKRHRTQLTSTGPNEEWSGDGHDKLNKIGIQVYGIRDKASGYWLGLWAVPNNREKEVVAYLYLELIEEYGGTLFATYLCV
jgi:spermidine/putrescine-binding protein